MFTFLLLALFSAFTAFSEEPEISEKLHLLWATGPVFDTPESVCYDAEQKVFYVSNVGGDNPWIKDGKGFISTLGADGKVLSLNWCDGIDAPKGMAVLDGKLFVANIDEVVIIHTADGTINERIGIEGAKALNDVEIDDEGTVYVSDSEAKAVYKLERGKFELLLQNSAYSRPNGLLFANGQLLLATGDEIVRIDRESGMAETYLLNTGGVDGIGCVDENIFIYSHWPGAVFVHQLNKAQQQLLKYPDSKMNTADILYLKEGNRLFIPTFFHKTVECYQLKLE